MKKEKVQKMTKPDFDKAMNDWAELYKIPADQRNTLANFISNYDTLVFACLSKGHGTVDERAAVKKALSPVYSFKPIPSAESMKKEAWNLQRALNSLSPSTSNYIERHLVESGISVPLDFLFLIPKLIEACECLRKKSFKSGRRHCFQRDEFIGNLCIFFKYITKKEPTSGEGCFMTLLSYALEKHEQGTEELSREIQKANRVIKRMAEEKLAGVKIIEKQ
jgi:hypothetical protein